MVASALPRTLAGDGAAARVGKRCRSASTLGGIDAATILALARRARAIASRGGLSRGAASRGLCTGMRIGRPTLVYVRLVMLPPGAV